MCRRETTRQSNSTHVLFTARVLGLIIWMDDGLQQKLTSHIVSAGAFPPHGDWRRGVYKILCIFPPKSLTKYFVKVMETEEEYEEEELGPAHDSK